MSALNIATRALTTNQAVLQVIGHNIANANTDGYTRQRVELNSVPGQQLGSGYFGKGVQIEAVVREGYNAFLTRESNANRAVAAADATRLQYLQGVESLFPLCEGSLGKLLGDALNSWTDVAASPNDSAARQVVLDKFDELAARIRDTSARITDIATGARLQATEITNEINRLAQAIANVNQAIARAQGTGASPNDLLDQRDRLIAQLNEQVQVTTLPADDGTLSVFVAGSLPLVLGSTAAELRAARADLDGDRQLKLQFVQGASTYDVPPEFIPGGKLKGVLDFVNRDVIQTQAELGRMALALATAVNQQHQLGLDLNGAPGGILLGFGPLVGKPASTNTGAGTVTAGVSNATQLRGEDYVIEIGGSGTYVRRTSDGYYWTGSIWQAAQTVASTLNPDGLSITISGGSVGDRFLLSPGASAAASLQMALSHPRQLAAATGAGGAVVEFDGRNAEAMLALRDQVMFDGSVKLSEGYVAVFSKLASRVNEAQTRATFSQAQAEDAEQRRANQAGVNLDEEAARLLQFQQAYQASAKYLQTVQSIFDTLISTFR
ncbi:flagellar hook-associated protein FlgK [Tepidimonas ignava]|uniref:flagellar hook-associated protein FlgK n=1 Tax=Tepidimonas ignava TaxID=114249 RepID=UPI002FD9BCC0